MLWEIVRRGGDCGKLERRVPVLRLGKSVSLGREEMRNQSDQFF